jgi:hypothetical protein
MSHFWVGLPLHEARAKASILLNGQLCRSLNVDDAPGLPALASNMVTLPVMPFASRTRSPRMQLGLCQDEDNKKRAH